MAELQAYLEDRADFVMPKVISILSSLLQRVADSNDFSCRLQPHKMSVFRGLTRPTISIQSYLERIFNSFTVHRLLITSVLVSAKFMDDIYCNNAFYAKVGGISTAEMNLLEVDFLFGLGFHLNVTPTTFHTYCSILQKEMFLQSPLHLPEPPLNVDRPLNHQCCFTEDESAHHKQLAV
ncbi:cyclin-U4-1-like isoform X2 [Mangifera indica]|uniref:cyclin-U4-1-like isoform X2 n=1 Tax=Mangifera indica TaxID=29780 RepID=UPI001CF9323D|nr:cyclin-U4-1-like isoform X2 [Mangifera indica]